MSFPAMDLPGYKRRSVLPASYIDDVETTAPGFVSKRLSKHSSRLGSQLRKRYGNSPQLGVGLPFGQGPAQPSVSGTAPPAVVLSGVPVLGSLEIVIAITLGGALGVAQFEWSPDGGITQNTGVVTAALVVLPGTGITAAFSAVGSYSTDNLYACDPPVPEVVLGWLTDLLNLDVLQKRGSMSPIDREPYEKAAEKVYSDVELAANSKDGLFDLPVNEVSDSNVRTGGPLMYTENSPYVSADQQACIGQQEDCQGGGSFY